MFNSPVERCVLALLLGAILVACSQAKPISYYAAHPAERRAKVDLCLAHGADNQDCVNAKQAEFDALGIPAVGGRATP